MIPKLIFCCFSKKGNPAGAMCGVMFFDSLMMASEVPYSRWKFTGLYILSLVTGKYIQ